MADTRKDRRAPVSLKVRFKSATVDEFIEQYSKDISRGGIFIKSKTPMAIGTLLKFEFQLKDESRLIHGVGRVVWKRDAADAAGDEEDPPGMGIKFIKMDPESRGLVENIVSSRAEEAGEYELGGGGAKPAGPRKKATVPFFPSTTAPEDMPPPEDRTAVRHASEFLASALSGADEEAAAEAAKRAEEARKRTAEIERQRAEETARQKAAEQEAREGDRPRATEASAEEAKVAESQAPAAKLAEAKLAAAKAEEAKAAAAKAAEAKAAEAKAEEAKAEEAKAAEAKAEGPKEEEAKAAFAATIAGISESEPAPVGPAAVEAAEQRPATTAAEAAETAPADGRQAEIEAAEKSAGEEPVEQSSAEEREAVEAERRDLEEAASRKVVGERAVTTDPPPSSESRSMGLPLVIGLVAVVAVGYVVWNNMQPATPQEPVVAQEPPEPLVEEEGALEEEELAAAGEEPVEEPAVPTVAVPVEATPEGATITVDGEAAGTAPTELQLPIGREVTVAVDAEGYAEASQQVTAVEEGQEPLSFELEALPYRLSVATTPEGARVMAGGRRVTAPGEIDLRNSRGEIAVTAVKAGYTRARQTIHTDTFSESDGAMRGTLQLTLEERARPAAPAAPARPAPREEPTSDEAADAPAGGGAAAEEEEERPAPERPAPARPAPEPPAPEPPAEAEPEPIPDNPFG